MGVSRKQELIAPGTHRFQIGTRAVPFIFFCLCDFAKGCGFVAMGDGSLGSSIFLETNLLEIELESKPEKSYSAVKQLPEGLM